MKRSTAAAEEWRPVVGYEGWYEVSSLGRVRRIAPAPGTRAGWIQKAYLHHTGYPTVTLSKDGILHHFTVHRLVALAFLGSPNPGYEVNHKDGNKTHCAVSNLEYVTRQENVRHGFILGLNKPLPRLRGEDAPWAKLTEQQVREIRSLKGSLTMEQIGKRYGVARTTIDHIFRGDSWKHVGAVA